MQQSTTPPIGTNSPDTSEASQVICLCKGLTRGDILTHFQDPAHNYDTLVRATGVGTQCTACLLDLDLIVDQACGEHATSRVIADPRPQANGHGLKFPIDQANSGLFLNAGG
ncbi:MAG: (2Fe-2S)-binding protein, partial [Alphaproteobacteria bacterium]